MESPVALVFLGLIAAATIVQATLLLSLVNKGRELAGRIEAIERDLRPRLQRVGDVVDNVGQLAEGVLRRLPEVESTLDDAMRKVRRTTGMVETLVVKPLLPLATAVALWRGFRTGASFYRASSSRS